MFVLTVFPVTCCVCTLGVIGYCQIPCTCTYAGDDVTGTRWVWSVVMTMTDCIGLVVHISLVFLLLLLSGDELNPGPLDMNQIFHC